MPGLLHLFLTYIYLGTHKRAMGTNMHNFVGLIVILWSFQNSKTSNSNSPKTTGNEVVKYDRSDCKNICNRLRRVFSNGHDPIHLHKLDKARAETKVLFSILFPFGKLARKFHGKGIKLRAFPQGYVISLGGVVVQYRRVEPKVPGSSPTQ